MERLPTEIWRQILSYLPRDELTSVRPVNFSFASLANEFLFRDISSPFSLQGLQNLVQLSQKPELSALVRSFKHPTDYTLLIKDPFKNADLHPCLNALQEDKLARLQTYLGRCRDQQAFIQSEAYGDLLCDAFTRFPNLTEVTLLSNLPHVHSSLQELQCISHVEDNVQVFYRPRPFPRDGVSLTAKIFWKMVDAMFHANTPLKNLDLSSGIWRDVFRADAERFERLEKVVGCCTTLRIFIDSDHELWNDKCKMFLDINDGRVLKFLSSFKVLQNLSVTFYYFPDQFMIEYEPYFSPSLGLVLGEGCTWPDLRTIELGDITTSASKLKEVIAHHRATLKSVNLRNIYLMGSWRDVIEDFKRNLRLEHFMLESISDNSLTFNKVLEYDSSEVKAMVDYTLNEGEILLAIS